MKKKSLMYLTALAAMMASCNSGENELLGGGPSGVETTVDGEVPVGFNAYSERSVSRSGLADPMDNAALKKTEAEGGGFGVFAYYTDLAKYNQSYIPNFMYNQGVFWDNNISVWQYSPVMYWPNEYGSDAQSDDEDKLTFFAYAPYVKHASAAAGSVEGDDSWGITGFSRNSAQGDPLVKYTCSFIPANSVDLCWGVCDQTEWQKIQSGNDYKQTMAKGLPWLNVERPHDINQKMTFTFKHALAQLNVKIDADVDGLTHAEGKDLLDGNTRVYVRSISFTGIAMKGALNLNNVVGGNSPEALWLDYNGVTDLPFGQKVTVLDGRRDGREGASGAEAANETPVGLNEKIIQTEDWANEGVTHTAKNLFNSLTDNSSVYVIPTGEQMTVTIVYDVETKSGSLAGTISDGLTPGVSVENKITKTVNFGASNEGLKSGKKYTLNLHLGMNSVKFDANVSDWDNSENTSADVWLPHNMAANQALSLNLGTATTMQLGKGTRTLTATTKPSNDPVTWTNSNDAVATIAEPAAGTRGEQTLENAGHTVIITPVATGTTVITATSSAGSASITVTVTDDTTQDVSVSLTKNELSMYVGETDMVTATTNPTGQTVTWSTSNGSVATVDQNGNITAVDAGLARITATTPSGKTATINLTVKAPEVTISQTSAEVVMSQTIDLTASVQPEGKTITWSSDDTNIATVSNGTVTGVNAGTTTIRAQVKNDQNQVIAEATCYLTVIPSAAFVQTAPTALTLTYDGSEKTLISDGVAKYGTMMYCISDTEPEQNSQLFKETKPTATNAGTYKVWYFVKGQSGFDNSETGNVSVTIKQKDVTLSFKNEGAVGGIIYKTVGDAAYTNQLQGMEDGFTVTYTTTAGSNATFDTSTGEFSSFISGSTSTFDVIATVNDTTGNYNIMNQNNQVSYQIKILDQAAASGANATGSPVNWGDGGTLTPQGDHNGQNITGQGL